MSLTRASDLPNQRRAICPRAPPGGGGTPPGTPCGVVNYPGFAEVILESRAEFQSAGLDSKTEFQNRRLDSSSEFRNRVLDFGRLARPGIYTLHRRRGKLRLRGDIGSSVGHVWPLSWSSGSSQGDKIPATPFSLMGALP